MVRAVATEKSYPKNAVVLTEGEMGDSLYMIQSGKVKVFIGDEEGREIILKILAPGDFFGEMSMIDKQPRSASVTTHRGLDLPGAHARRVRALRRAGAAHRQHGDADASRSACARPTARSARSR